MKKKVNKIISFLSRKLLKKSKRLRKELRWKQRVKKGWRWLKKLSLGQKVFLGIVLLAFFCGLGKSGKFFWFFKRAFLRRGYLEAEKKNVISKGGVRVELPEGVLVHNGRVSFKKVKEDRVSKPEMVEEMGEVFLIESDSLLNGEIKVTFEEKTRDEVLLVSEDGKNWQWRDPMRGYSKTYDLTEFGYISLARFKRLDERFVKKDKEVAGRIRFNWRPKFDWPDRQLRNVAEGVRVGLFLKLGEGIWGQEIEGKVEQGGGFRLVIPKGRVYGISGKDKLEFKMRVYAEKKDVCGVSRLKGDKRGRIYFETKIVEIEEGRGGIWKDLVINDDESAAFNLVSLISFANQLVRENTSKLIGPAEIVLGDFSSVFGGEEKTGFNDVKEVILVDSQPPAQWDEQEILSGYGKFVMYSLRGKRMPRPDFERRLTSEERVGKEVAYQRGWSWFFAGLVSGTSDYRVYRDNIGETPYFEVNLEYDPRNRYRSAYPGAVAEIFWDLADGERLLDKDKDGGEVALKSVFEALGANILGGFSFYHRPATAEEYFKSLIKHDLGEATVDQVCRIFRRNGVRAGECAYAVMDEKGEGKKQKTEEVVGEEQGLRVEEEKDRGKVQKK